ncbi:GNAT family N-acetyltransferase [Brevibacterium luteolum]|uniref:GNAT family N-acetyltransferase n=1 Tax=Brevibacterium luteolum TaxID=199591 RepID=UPI003B66E3EE
MNTDSDDLATQERLVLTVPSVAGLAEVVQTLSDWQNDGSPWQLHPGDIGWFCRNGAETAADAVRIWKTCSDIVAIGLLDGPNLLRLTTAPEVRGDQLLARRLAADISNPDVGVLPASKVAVEAPGDAVVQTFLAMEGWGAGEAFIPLHRDLSTSVEPSGIEVRTVVPSEADSWARVLRSAFGTSSPTTSRWQAMVGSPVYGDAACLVGYDNGEPVAATSVWSAGPGRPGLIEPMGVHENFRGRGFGRAITIAAAAVLQEMGSSSARVYTLSSNTGGIATYQAARFRALPLVRDMVRCSWTCPELAPGDTEVTGTADQSVTVLTNPAF